MKKIWHVLTAAALMLCMAATAFAANPWLTINPDGQAAVCYPTAVTRSEDGTEIRKMYDLGPNDDPAGIPRTDFDQEGFHYTLTDLLKQELPDNESRQQTETVSIPSDSKDMASILALLPEKKEFITDDGLKGVLSLKLETVKVEIAGYGSATRSLSATRTYPSLGSQDTSCIPKSISDNGHTLTLQTVNWQTSGYGEDGSEHYTAVATYTGSATSSYVKGYTVTADYTGTVSRIILNKTRYVAIYEGVCLNPVVEEPEPEAEPEPLPDPFPTISELLPPPEEPEAEPASFIVDTPENHQSSAVQLRPSFVVVGHHTNGYASLLRLAVPHLSSPPF